uniref:Uncharacterized protein n=1 Tax=Mesocestoides corti TaxID=53468 RepID=A0A5K3ERX1_MESCO
MNCRESCLFTPLNLVAPPPTQGSPFRSMSPAARSLNSPSFTRILILDYPHT